MKRDINLTQAEYKLGGDSLDVATATAMALIDIAQSLRELAYPRITIDTAGSRDE